MQTLWRLLKRLIIGLTLLIVAAAVTVFIVSRPPAASNELLLFGGDIITMSDGPAPAAVLIRNGKIAALGARRALQSQLGEHAETLDLQGDSLLPGLIEPHTHPIASALLGTAIDVSGFQHNSRDEVLATLRAAIDGPQLSEWIIAFGWDPVMVADLTPPTRAELDALSPDRPLLILTQMMHDAYVNSAGLAAAGITLSLIHI